MTAMTYRALATDYDGTLAHDGCVDAPTIEALGRARDNGLRLIMVTGRELDDLLQTFPQTTMFDRVVAENGAVLYDPEERASVTIAAPALKALDIAATETIGVGDAENDHAFLRMCGLSVAVDNALPSIKESADFVTSLSRGAGDTELITLYLSGALERILPNPANHIARSDHRTVGWR
jgi:hydroxymethylpyrimidine pyrophosphatase-like HAD family hydrolase